MLRTPLSMTTTTAFTLVTAGVLVAASCRPVSQAPAPSNTPGLPTAATRISPLTPTEAQLRDAVDRHYDEYVNLLQRSVDIPSGSLNVAGVRRVGELFAANLRSLGFETQLVEQPPELRRGPHLVAVHRGTRGPRILLIGHLDTVFEGEGLGWQRIGQDTIARGAGSNDMKGGDAGMLLALRALNDVGLLKDMQIRVVMTGDEESAGRPVSIARAPLIDAARQSDVALAFEGGSATRIGLGRRGASEWRLIVSARQAHSGGIFSQGTGYGAVYEGARIIDEFRRQIAGPRGLTFSVGIAGGGAHVELDSANYSLKADGKSNIIPPIFVAQGDLRFMTDGQKDSARVRMRAIVGTPLEGAQSQISFEDEYPAMPVTPVGLRLLSMFSTTSQSLGYPAVGATAPEDRGAGDVSFVAPIIPGLDGLGVSGQGAHSPRESVNLNSLRMSGERAAVFMERLLSDWSQVTSAGSSPGQ
jgi:glutamate carboxypeptidase